MEVWPAPATWHNSINRLRGVVVLCAAVATLLALLAEFGLAVGNGLEPFIVPGYYIAAVAVALEAILSAWTAPRVWAFIRSRPVPSLLLLGLFIEFLALRFGGDGRDRLLERSEHIDLARAYFVIIQIYVGGSLLFAIARVNRRLSRTRLSPGRLALTLFIGLIALGTLLLELPRMASGSTPIGWVDALFTATSAVCVTGLTVLPTDTAFSGSGHFVLALLIQLGGLGIMSFTGFLAVASGMGLGIRERAFLADILHTAVVGQVAQQLRWIFLFTLGVEFLGFLLLLPTFRSLDAPGSSWGHAAFHSISAFCNAGFSTIDGNLLALATDRGANLVLVLLIALGGIGFGTVLAVWSWLRRRRGGRARSIPLSARLVLLTSGVLWVGAAISFAALEWNGAFAHLDGVDRAIASVFQSVTARTAGFNTVDTAALSGASVLLLMVLMFIGGAPGSTAGGVKVTTIAVMFGAVRSLFSGSEQVSLRGRAVHDSSIREAMVIVFVGGMAVIAGLLLLLWVEKMPFVTLAFEAVSALGTTGLSLGATPLLSDAGKLILVLLMLIGRVGPLTLVFAMGRRAAARHRYPQEHVQIG